MNQIIIASHGDLAFGMKNTVEFFGGTNIEYIEQTMTDTEFDNKAKKMIEKYKDYNCIVFTDLYGGSVNQCFYRLLNDYSFHLVTGMNLSVIMECVFASQDIDDDFIRNAIQLSKSQFTYMNDINVSDEDDD